jgi:hypothetical protein
VKHLNLKLLISKNCKIGAVCGGTSGGERVIKEIKIREYGRWTSYTYIK